MGPAATLPSVRDREVYWPPGKGVKQGNRREEPHRVADATSWRVSGRVRVADLRGVAFGATVS